MQRYIIPCFGICPIFAASKMAVLPHSIVVRQARAEDLEAVYGLIHELAVYEKEPGEPSNPFDVFFAQGTGSDPWYRVLVAEHQNEIIGMALYFRAYSTWKGAMYYMDDIVVKEAYRQHGIGSQLMNKLVDEAMAEGINLIKWQVLDWNEPAIRFYKKYNVQMDGGEWLNCRLFKEDFKQKI
jgi:GNAT superfamily N-acetyltransferase